MKEVKNNKISHNFIPFSKRTAKYCSLKCCNSDETFLKNKENTYLAKYGVKNIQESEEMKQKIKLKLEKCLKNDPDYWKKRQEKTNNTKIKKYGSLINAYLNEQNNFDDNQLIDALVYWYIPKNATMLTYDVNDYDGKFTNTRGFRTGSVSRIINR